MAKRIDVAGLSAYYGPVKAIEDISMTVEPRTVTAFIGPSGCGKSTFLRTLNRMHEVIPGGRVEGQVMLDDKDLYASSVDPVSAATVTAILKKYVAAGGTVVLSSHSMDLVQRMCDHVAVIVGGELLADGTMDEVRGGQTLEERCVELAGGRTTGEGLEWLHSFY